MNTQDEQPLPTEHIPKDILDLQETIRLMVYAPLDERQRLAWKLVGPFDSITPAQPAHTKGEPTPDLKEMALNVVTAWDSKGVRPDIRLLKIIEAQLHAAYALGETDADYRAGRVLNSLAAAPETAAERDRLRARLAEVSRDYAKVVNYASERDQAREQVKTLLAACKEAEDAIGHDKYGTGDLLRAAIAAVENPVREDGQ